MSRYGYDPLYTPSMVAEEPNKLTFAQVEEIINSDVTFSDYLDGSDSGPVLDLIAAAIETKDEAIDEIEIIAVIDEILLMRKHYIHNQ